jgi:Cu-Zn family superoxide dismutase
MPKRKALAVAVFDTTAVKGEVTFANGRDSVLIEASFTKLPAGEHGFHIHRAGDLRGEGCKMACDHFHVGEDQAHGGPPGFKGERHTGDLGNISLPSGFGNIIRSYSFKVRGIQCEDLWGRSMIVHADPDDYGLGDKEDSKTTGHSGKRIACAVIGRTAACET